MKILCAIFAVAVYFVVGQALNCYKCSAGVAGVCITSQTTCNAGEQCFSGDGKAVGFINIKTKGCLTMDMCNKTTNENISVAGSSASLYTITKTCCITDLCNDAPGLPASLALSLALATIASLFVANMV